MTARKTDLLGQISSKNLDPATIADQALRAPALIGHLIAGLSAKEAAVKYGCDKALRLISARQPELLYPHFDFFSAMLDCDNSFLKWGAISTIANLARADTKNKFDLIFDKYFSPIPGPVMITAANTIGGAARIALAKPWLADRIAVEILKVDKAKYRTAECRNVAIGHAIDAFDLFMDRVQDRKHIIRFVKRQRVNSRAPVRRRAAKFLIKHERANPGGAC